MGTFSRLALITVVLVLGVVAFSLVGRSSHTLPTVDLDQGRSRRQGGFLRGACSEPKSLCPLTTIGAVARQMVLRYTHDALLELDPTTGELRPSLAESYAAVTQGTEARFRIRDGVRFCDGTVLTMADVTYAYDLESAGVAVSGIVAQALADVADMRVEDERTLVVRFHKPSFTTLQDFATRYLVVRRAWYVELLGVKPVADALGKLTLSGPGTGPYRLHRWRSNIDVVLVQNPYSWRLQSRPNAWNLAGMQLRFLPDEVSRLLAFRGGELDWLQHPRADELLREDRNLAKRVEVHRYDHLDLGHFAVLWNHRREPLHDARFRFALDLLFDRKAIVEELMAGQGEISETWFRPSSPLGRRESEVRFDVGEARRRIQELGLDSPQIRIIHSGSESLHRRILDLARPSMAEAGVDLVPVPMEWGGMVSRLRSGDFDAMLVHVSLTPKVDPYVQFHSSQIDGGRNWIGYVNNVVDDLLAKARFVFDNEERSELYRRFNRIYAQDVPMTLLAHPISTILLTKRFAGVEIGVLGLFPEMWWLRHGY